MLILSRDGTKPSMLLISHITIVLNTINPYIGRQVSAIFLRGISHNAPDITIYKAKYIISIRLWAVFKGCKKPKKKYAISQGSTYKIDAKMCTLHWRLIFHIQNKTLKIGALPLEFNHFMAPFFNSPLF